MQFCCSSVLWARADSGAALCLLMPALCGLHPLCVACRWGGLLCGPNPSITEERFYLSEYTTAERAAGAHLAVLAFAHEAHRERDPQGERRWSCHSILPSLQLPGCSAQCCCCSQAQHSSSSNGVGDVHGSGASRTDGNNRRRQSSTANSVPTQLPAPSQTQNKADVQLVPVNAAGSSTAGSSTCTGRGSGSSHGGTKRYDLQPPA